MVFKTHQPYVLKVLSFISSILSSNDVDLIWLISVIKKGVSHFGDTGTPHPLLVSVAVLSMVC